MQLEGRYFVSMEPEHVQVSTPVEEAIDGVSVMVLAEILGSPFATAVMAEPFHVTPETYFDT